MTGFIAIQRSILDHHLVGTDKNLRPWLWMLTAACWKATPFDLLGTTITLERGQFCASIRQMASEWGWSKSAVERFLRRLETETMIVRKAGQGRCIITICNYDKYQSRESDKRDSSGTASGTAAGQQRDIKEEGNKGTIEEEPSGSSSVAREREKSGATKTTKGLIPNDWRPAEFSKGTTCRKVIDGWPPGDPENGVVAELDFQIERFIAHHQARGSFMADWQAAWKTWVLNSRNFGSNNGKRANNQDRRDALARELDERLGVGTAG